MVNAPTSLGSFALPPTLVSSQKMLWRNIKSLLLKPTNFKLEKDQSIKALLSTCRPPILRLGTMFTISSSAMNSS